MLDRLDGVVADSHRRGSTLFAVTDPDRLWLAESWPDPPEYEVARVAMLPALTPLLAHRQHEVPYVVALVDRAGADLVVVERERPREESIERDLGPVARKSAPGGWSQRRFQQRAEEAWAKTAHEIADALVADVERVGAELVVMAGDVREVQLVIDALPERIRELVHVVAGGRAAGTDDAALEAEVRRLTRTAMAQASVALLRKLKEELGQGDRGVVGVEATFAALRKAQVQVLFVHDDPADERLAWFGPSPMAIGTTPETTRLDDEPVEQARLVDIAVRSAIGSSADLRVVPHVGSIHEGIGAILRWSD
jgi:peptide subunit release factor 1 (eRF1)